MPQTADLVLENSEALALALADREAYRVRDLLGEAEPPLVFGGDLPATHVSPRAFTLIVNHETGGRAYYEHVYKARPVWPGESSGVTIGFGYDLGYYSAAQFSADWATLGAPTLARLQAAVGKHGGTTADAQLRQLVHDLRDISIPWDSAEQVFKATTLPRYAASTWNALPNCADLSNDSFGALVSLTFNRGASYTVPPAKDPHNRYAEMRAIRQSMVNRAYPEIPKLIRAMKHIWAGTTIAAEMTKRREDEAALFEQGLATA
jgi:GH24 family phage-related lysozyme (muramidase)